MVAPRVLSPWDSPGKNTGVGSHFLLQGIFPTQGSNPGPLHCRRILYHLSTQLLINTVPNSLLLSGNACLYITLALQLRTFPSCPTLWSWWVQILSQVRKSSLLSHDCMRSCACRPVFEEGVDSTRDDWGKEEAWKLLTSSGRLEHWFFFLSPQTHFCPQPPILLNTLSSSNFPPLPLPPSLSLSLSLAHLSTLISCPLFNIFPFGVFTHKTQFLLSIMRFTAFLCTSICRFTKTFWTSSV